MTQRRKFAPSARSGCQGANQQASRVVHLYLPDVQGTPVGAYWWHVRINGNDGVLDMHLKLRWGVGHVALLIFVSQHSTKLILR